MVSSYLIPRTTAGITYFPYFASMNFLGHIYLTKSDKELLLGNFMADSIKGNSYLDYSENIQKGILFHRFIDSYTDNHPAFRKSTAKLHADFSHFSGVLVDVFYDHFLAKNWQNFHPTPLEEFAQEFYAYMEERYDVMTSKMQYIFPHMKANNWLVRYASLEGIEKTLSEMGGRIGREYELDKSVKNLEREYTSFERDFEVFIAAIEEATNKKRRELLLNNPT